MDITKYQQLPDDQGCEYREKVGVGKAKETKGCGLKMSFILMKQVFKLRHTEYFAVIKGSKAKVQAETKAPSESTRLGRYQLPRTDALHLRREDECTFICGNCGEVPRSIHQGCRSRWAPVCAGQRS